AVLETLLGAEVDECLTLDLRVAGDVVDVFLRIDGGDLPANLLQALDNPNGRVSMTCVVGGREAGRAGAEDRDVDDVAHARMLARGLLQTQSPRAKLWCPRPGWQRCVRTADFSRQFAPEGTKWRTSCVARTESSARPS